MFTLQVILHDSVMGIRYYAYAVEADRIEDALECPSMFLSCDPLADALGMEVGAMSGTAIMRQVVPEQDMLYLDKAWSELQELSRTGGLRRWTSSFLPHVRRKSVHVRNGVGAVGQGC